MGSLSDAAVRKGSQGVCQTWKSSAVRRGDRRPELMCVHRGLTQAGKEFTVFSYITI